MLLISSVPFRTKLGFSQTSRAERSSTISSCQSFPLTAFSRASSTDLGFLGIVQGDLIGQYAASVVAGHTGDIVHALVSELGGVFIAGEDGPSQGTLNLGTVYHDPFYVRRAPAIEVESIMQLDSDIPGLVPYLKQELAGLLVKKHGVGSAISKEGRLKV